jgi:hypothetical protein
MEEKKCKFCAMMIPKDAKICPHCRKKQGTSTIVKILAVIFGLMVIGAIMNGITGKPTTTGVAVGKEAILNGGGQETLMAISEPAYDEWTKAAAAKDKYGMGILLTSGRAFTVKSGTKVLVIDQSMFKRKVRILEGKQKGLSGWAAMEHVK